MPGRVDSRLRLARASQRLAAAFPPAPVPMSTALLIDLVKGIVVGIVIALPVGPVGVLCVRRTLFEGPSFGFISGLGAATADTIFGIIAGFGLTIVRDVMLGYQDWFGAAGGLFLLYLGIRVLRRGSDADPEPLADEALLGAYASAFALTITNPITILAFAAVFAKVGVSETAGYLDTGALVAGVFCGSLLWWLGLSFGIARLRRGAGVMRLVWLNRVSGAILTVSGLGLIAAALVAAAGRVV
jgi:threonine/homoserine/homoserine lactone efflux protein